MKFPNIGGTTFPAGELTKEQMQMPLDHMAALGGEQIASGSDVVYVAVDGKAHDI